MDDAKRLELKARQAASAERARARSFARDRAAFVRGVPILAALEDAGEDYDSYGYERLNGALNEWAHAPDRWPMRVMAYAPMPDADSARAAALATTLDSLTSAAGLVLVILRSEDLVLEMHRATLQRHITVLVRCDLHCEIGFTDHSSAWFVEANQRGIATGVIGASEP